MRSFPMRIIMAASFFLAASPAFSQDRPDPVLTEILKAVDQNTRDFWQQVEANGGTPVVEYGATSDDPVSITFLWRGADLKEVELSWPVWTPDRRENHLIRLGNSDICYKTVTVPARTRLSYQIAPDPARGVAGDREAYRAGLLAALRPDPLNPRRMGDASILELKGAPQQPFIAERAEVPKGRSNQVGDHRLSIISRTLLASSSIE